MMVLGLAAMDAIEEQVLAGIEAALEDNFPLRTRRVTPVAMDGAAYDATRKQHSAPLALKRVLDRGDKRTDKLLAVTGCDLFIPMLSFVYGQAQLSGRGAIVSVARLRQGFYGLPENVDLLVARARKEAVHETGHLYGLVHCREAGCAMGLSTNVWQIDVKNEALCGGCRARIREGLL